MNDMLKAITPKSDQVNYDDFLAGQTKTIKITSVSFAAKEQPVSLNYEGDNGKPFKPCKSMCRVLVHVWGADAKAYVGKSMTLYGDPKVRYGAAEVGGIRISHMSHIKEPVTMALTSTRSNRKPYTVRPLGESPVDAAIESIKSAATLDELKAAFTDAQGKLKDHKELARVTEEKEKRKGELSVAPVV